MTEETVVNSPCVGVCYMNENELCEGCYRTSEEIVEWSAMNNDQKRETLTKCDERYKELNSHLQL